MAPQEDYPDVFLPAAGPTATEERPAAVDDVISAHLAAQTREVLATLTPREEKVLRMRFGIGEPAESETEIGADFEATRERIRQIEAKALRMLRGADAEPEPDEAVEDLEPDEAVEDRGPVAFESTKQRIRELEAKALRGLRGEPPASGDSDDE